MSFANGDDDVGIGNARVSSTLLKVHRIGTGTDVDEHAGLLSRCMVFW